MSKADLGKDGKMFVNGKECVAAEKTKIRIGVIMEKMSEADLTAESLKASAYYLKKTQQEGLSMVEKAKITNSFAHGFFCGVRWKEEQDEKNNVDQGDDEEFLV